MNENPSDDAQLRSYLFDELPEPEADALERRLLADDELFDLLEAHEAELLAAASRGELPPAEKERVLRRLAASPGGRERLALAWSLNAEADHRAEAPASARVLPFLRRSLPPKAVWSGLAAAASLLLVIGAWFVRQRFDPDLPAPVVAERVSPIRPAPSKQLAPPIAETPTPEDSQAEVAQKQEESRSAAERRRQARATIVLSFMTLRGAGEVGELSVPPGTDLVEIVLDLEGLVDLDPYHAAVRNQENEAIWEQADLVPKELDWGTALLLEVPAERLPSGRYKVDLTAGPETLTQEFIVLREGR
jgi:hypothetical protein